MEGQQSSSSNDMPSSVDNANVSYLSSLDQEEKALVSHIKNYIAQLSHIREQKLRATHLNVDDPTSSKQVAFLKSQTEMFKNMIEMIESDDTQGFVYGIITNNGKIVSEASENLRSWWESTVQFGYRGPQAITKHILDSFTSSPSPLQTAPVNIREKLSEISDPTLSSLISALMQHCNPPQKHRPFEMGVPPPWWPSPNEPWWDELGFSDLDQPPYKKPHDLKKVCKVALLTAIIYHLSPNTDHIRVLVWQSKTLQEKMTSRDNTVWLSVLEQIDRQASLHVTGSSSNEENRNMYSFAPQGQVPFMRFTCANVRCPHHLIENGFPNQLLRNAHQNSCPYNMQFGSNQMNAGNFAYHDYGSFVYHPNVMRNVDNDSMVVNLQGFQQQVNVNDGGVCYPGIDVTSNAIHDQAGTSDGSLHNLQATEPDMMGAMNEWVRQNI